MTSGKKLPSNYAGWVTRFKKTILTMKKILFLFSLATIFYGCAIGLREIVVPNPIIDSNISLSEALRKYSPPEIKEEQSIVNVQYYSFDGKVHQGQLVIDKRLVGDIRRVFQVALKNKFPISCVIPISHDRFYSDGKWNEDNQSMLSDNSAGFNYRKVTGGAVLSMHAYGFAMDINPVQNPYIKGDVVLPVGAVYDPRAPGTFTRDCPVVKTFIRLGWTWGGNWRSLKDYQHFEKVPAGAGRRFLR